MPDEREPRIGGSYPGGPSRQGRGEERGEPRLERVDEIEERMSRARGRAARDRRARRIRIGFVLALCVAAGTGLALGLMSDRSTEDIAREREEERMQSRDVSQEVNRVLLELWKMEDLERVQRPPR